MEQSILSVRVNAKDKKSFETFCEDMGMNVSTAINMFIKTVIREQKIPFEIKNSHFEKNIYERLKESEREMEKNKKLYTLEEVIEGIQKKLDE